MIVLPEIVAAGIYDFELAKKNTTTSKNRRTSMFEIELPIEEGGVLYIDSVAMPVSTNILVCAKPEQTRHGKAPFKCYYVHLIVKEGALYDALVNAPDFITINNTDKYKRIFIELIQHYNLLSDKEEVIVHSLLLELVYEIINDTSSYKKSNNKTNNQIIEKTIEYIKYHLTDDLSLETISNTMSLSPIYFHNLFKASTGKTLGKYVEEQRIKKAINLLITTNYNLTQIAYNAGFSSQSYFSYVFKRKMKVTPRQYVKEVFERYEE